jgi:hypothetical protein
MKFEGLCNKKCMDISFFVQIYLGSMIASTPIILFLKIVGIFERNFCVNENRESFRISCGRGGTRVGHCLHFLETPYIQRYNLAT